LIEAHIFFFELQHFVYLIAIFLASGEDGNFIAVLQEMKAGKDGPIDVVMPEKHQVAGLARPGRDGIPSRGKGIGNNPLLINFSANVVTLAAGKDDGGIQLDGRDHNSFRDEVLSFPFGCGGYHTAQDAAIVRIGEIRLPGRWRQRDRYQIGIEFGPRLGR